MCVLHRTMEKIPLILLEIAILGVGNIRFEAEGAMVMIHSFLNTVLS